MRDFEIWASPEATIARVDEEHSVDQLALTGHDRREMDVALLGGLGVDASRAPVLWERAVAEAPTVIDLEWAKRRVAAVATRGMAPIVTLLDHGSGPRFTNLLDPAFPSLFGDYAAMVALALPWVRRWTPIDEPLATARMSTLEGSRHPNRRDDRAFGRALVHLTLAQQTAMTKIRAVQPNAEFVFTEELQSFAAGDEAQRDDVAFRSERAYLAIELCAGRVDVAHPLWQYLIERCGVTEEDLNVMRAGATTPDLVAFNHYPHSERYLFATADGTAADIPSLYVRGEEPPRAAPLLWQAAQRLRMPLALGEVHVNGTPIERVRWLAQHVEDVAALRDAGIDLRAVGVGAAFGMTDWRAALGNDAGAPQDGVFTFAGATGLPERTQLADAVCELVRDGTVALPDARGWWERDDRFMNPHDIAALRAAGVPEGDHIVPSSGEEAHRRVMFSRRWE
ncbi:MAG TPA: family 1 glycosylhydrolase [Candidatus Elarobacter sp.]